MAQAVGFQLHCGFLSSLFVQATSECLLNTYGSPGTCLAQCITLACSCQKSLHFCAWLITPCPGYFRVSLLERGGLKEVACEIIYKIALYRIYVLKVAR